MWTPPAAALVLLVLVPATATPAGSADQAWIGVCIKQRATSDLPSVSARPYCSCMQEIVEANEPFGTITALERAYPPAHRRCLTKAGQRRASSRTRLG